MEEFEKYNPELDPMNQITAPYPYRNWSDDVELDHAMALAMDPHMEEVLRQEAAIKAIYDTIDFRPNEKQQAQLNAAYDAADAAEHAAEEAALQARKGEHTRRILRANPTSWYFG